MFLHGTRDAAANFQKEVWRLTGGAPAAFRRAIDEGAPASDMVAWAIRAATPQLAEAIAASTQAYLTSLMNMHKLAVALTQMIPGLLVRGACCPRTREDSGSSNGRRWSLLYYATLSFRSLYLEGQRTRAAKANNAKSISYW